MSKKPTKPKFPTKVTKSIHKPKAKGGTRRRRED